MKKRCINTEGKKDTEGKKALVVKAAMRLFVELGYHNVSIPAIVKASGVSTGAIYHHFANKESLARYIHEQALADFQQRLAGSLEGKEGACQKLQAFAMLVLDIAESDPLMMEYMLFMKHGEFLTDIQPICYSEPFRWVQYTVAEGMATGEIKRGDVLVVAGSFTGVLFRNIELRLSGVLDVPLGRVADQVVAHAWNAIRV